MYISTCLHGNAKISACFDELTVPILFLQSGSTNHTLLRKLRPKTAKKYCKSYILNKNTRLNIIESSKMTAEHNRHEGFISRDLQNWFSKWLQLV